MSLHVLCATEKSTKDFSDKVENCCKRYSENWGVLILLIYNNLELNSFMC